MRREWSRPMTLYPRPLSEHKDFNAKAVEVSLNEAADLIGSCCEQPADPSAWEHLLVYCPRELLEKRLRSLEHKDRIADRHRRRQQGGRLWLEHGA